MYEQFMAFMCKETAKILFWFSRLTCNHDNWLSSFLLIMLIKTNAFFYTKEQERRDVIFIERTLADIRRIEMLTGKPYMSNEL